MPNTEPFEKYAQEYESWFEKNPWAYDSEVEALRTQVPASGLGIEIGVGSGRFAEPLGIKVGVDPSARMRVLAKKRGIRVVDAKAEKLPFEDASFDHVLMVTTICFLDDVLAAFREVMRILKPEGVFVIGFVDKDSALGRQYQEKKDKSKFYRSARFYSPDEVTSMARQAGFNRFQYVQTLFGNIREMDRTDPVKEGVGHGSFVVIKAGK
ncbi:MAG: class I SAM-dependent methyltransferase [Desulfobulbaceae bacterium]|nr:class I SAM-dependent methyltransferase [Desulfobulbaceae bacterium]